MKGEDNLSLFYKEKRESKRRLKNRPKHKKRHLHNAAANISTERVEISGELGRLDYSESTSSLFKKMHLIRSSQKQEIFLDFKNLRKIYPFGMLWLYSEIYQKISKSHTTIKCNYPKDRKCEKVLQHIEFFKLIKKESRIPSHEITEEDVVSWRVLYGNESDGEKVAGFLDKFIAADDSKNESIYVTIMEMIANVTEHAYTDDHQYKTWMIFGRLSDDGKELSIHIGDLGQTVPYTVRKWLNPESWKKIQLRRFGRWITSDCNLIKLAITHEAEISGKFEKYRGKGLFEASRLIGGLGGRIATYSGKGYYLYPGKNALSLKNKVPGTIIEVLVPLSHN